MTVGKLTFFCGKMGAGKSTRAKNLSQESPSILISEDQWLAALYPDEISTLGDYVEKSNRLKPQIKQLTQSILVSGIDVILDFPANTVGQREWFKTIYEEIDAPHQLIYINVSDEICLKQIAKRRKEQPDREKTDTPEMFEAVTQYFNEPKQEEGFNIL